MNIQTVALIAVTGMMIVSFLIARRTIKKLMFLIDFYKQKTEELLKDYNVLSEQYRQLNNINKAFRDIASTKLSIKNKDGKSK